MDHPIERRKPVTPQMLRRARDARRQLVREGLVEKARDEHGNVVKRLDGSGRLQIVWVLTPEGRAETLRVRQGLLH